ncbi:hypothetical protein SAMN05216207_104633 [Pseudonocardia ammonioxydans]|uniref:Uncharacterized protein n=1 Tax=Pseudonocardia ammonioxydans TaxID=260086 RepID=A0A1I5GFT4_PSUAM|nr:hypothetical protein [Pseudonocardia ammonioxydans]SFO34864.1 hypothetical protein SAMN05216207_104633 [Pseudonocardia ammonioxydans]
MRDQTSRSGNGPATPPTCPDCGAEATPPVGAGGHQSAPTGWHRDGCPVAAAERDRTRDDVAELDRLRAAGVRPLLRRRLAWTECVALEIMAGRPVPRRLRRLAVVSVVRVAPTTLLRVVEHDGLVLSAQVADVPAVAR